MMTPSACPTAWFLQIHLPKLMLGEMLPGSSFQSVGECFQDLSSLGIAFAPVHSNESVC